MLLKDVCSITVGCVCRHNIAAQPLTANSFRYSSAKLSHLYPLSLSPRSSSHSHPRDPLSLATAMVQQQQHRIYILQFRKGEPEQEVACKVSQPKGAGRRVMYHYQDYGSGGGKSGKQVQPRALGLRR